MNATNRQYNHNNHIKSNLNNDLIFNSSAVEITVLDRWGNAVWKKRQDEALRPITWSGIDRFGEKVSSGSYLCKIVYSGEPAIYIPLVFIQK